MRTILAIYLYAERKVRIRLRVTFCNPMTNMRLRLKQVTSRRIGGVESGSF